MVSAHFVCPTKSVSARSCRQSLPCAGWLDQTWAFLSPPLFPVTSCADVQAASLGSVSMAAWATEMATEMVSCSCFPSPFSVHTSAVKYIKWFFLERSVRREPLCSSGRIEQLWSHFEPGDADPSWERASVESLSSWAFLGTNPFTLCSPSVLPKHLLESCWGREGCLAVKQNTHILKPSSLWRHPCSGSVQFEFYQVLSVLGWSFVTGFSSGYYW